MYLITLLIVQYIHDVTMTTCDRVVVNLRTAMNHE